MQWGCGDFSANIRFTPQVLNQRSKIKEIKPKMARRRGSDARQWRRSLWIPCKHCRM